MTFLLPDLRDDVLADLRDTANARFTDAQVDRAIARVVAEYSQIRPRQQTKDITTSSRDIDLAAELGADYEALVQVVAAEFPTGNWPPTYVRFDIFGGTLRLHSTTEPSGDTVTLGYHLQHTLDAATGTIPDADREAIATGASAYALMDLATGRFDELNVSSDTLATIRQLAANRTGIWEHYKKRMRATLRNRTLYRPADPYPGRDIVRFPD